MDDRRLVKISKYLSAHLRHRPERIGIVLDQGGWTPVERLLEAMVGAGVAVSRDELRYVVEHNDKRRFELDPVEDRIRAAQGHSIGVDLGLEASVPPEVLYHGTGEGTLAVISEQGLLPMGRDDVHLSESHDTAGAVGRRHGPPVVLRVDAAAMHREGHAFFLSANGVWLTKAVPPGFLSWPRGAQDPV